MSELCSNNSIASMSSNDSFPDCSISAIMQISPGDFFNTKRFLFFSKWKFHKQKGIKSNWSSVEINWVCIGGSTTSKDTWVAWVPPRKRNHYLLLFIYNLLLSFQNFLSLKTKSDFSTIHSPCRREGNRWLLTTLLFIQDYSLTQFIRSEIM